MGEAARDRGAETEIRWNGALTARVVPPCTDRACGLKRDRVVTAACDRGAETEIRWNGALTASVVPPRANRSIGLKRNRVSVTTRDRSAFAEVPWNRALAEVVESPCADQSTWRLTTVKYSIVVRIRHSAGDVTTVWNIVAIAVNARFARVTDSIGVAVQLQWVRYKHTIVDLVENAVVVVIGVGVVALTVAVRVGGFIRIQRECVCHIRNTVAIGVKLNRDRVLVTTRDRGAGAETCWNRALTVSVAPPRANRSRGLKRDRVIETTRDRGAVAKISWSRALTV